MLTNRKPQTIVQLNQDGDDAFVQLNKDRNEKRRLYFYDEVDEWQQDNVFIRSGYVKETKSYKECIRSLSYWHNESINIYSHLIPSVVTLCQITYVLMYELPNFEVAPKIWEILNFYQFGFAATFCLFLSASFHCFKCHSHKVSKMGNQCDYFGIIVLITCSLNSIVLFAFHDIPHWRNFYIGLFAVLGVICTKITFDSKFATPAYRPFRSLMFVTFGLSGVLPVVTAVAKFGVQQAEDRSNASWLICEGFFYILGACLYAARIPERFTHVEDNCVGQNRYAKGMFDLVGHSHQIFHIMVVIAAFCHWKALVGCYIYLHEVTLTSRV